MQLVQFVQLYSGIDPRGGSTALGRRTNKHGWVTAITAMRHCGKTLLQCALVHAAAALLDAAQVKGDLIEAAAIV